MKIGVLTGLVREADCFNVLDSALRPLVLCSAARPHRAREAASVLVSKGCRGLVSFGMAGGLDPSLKTGSLVIPEAVIAPGGRRYHTDAAWVNGLKKALSPDISVHGGGVLGTDAAVTSPAAKGELFEATGAVALDMESHIAAEAAARANLPFMAIRAVSDDAAGSVPDWVLGAIGEDGKPRTLAIAAGAVVRLWQIPDLIALARGSGKALAVLRRVASIPGLGFG